MLLCAGNRDPAVLYLNTELMQNFWSSETSGHRARHRFRRRRAAIRTSRRRNNSPPRRQSWSWRGGDDEVLQLYHAGLVAPFCLSAVKSFFDGN